MAPSPEPVLIVELDVIRLLWGSGAIVVCAGGGGVPVTRDSAGGLHGVEAVLDKDLTAAFLARTTATDALLLLTDVPAVIDGYGTASARPISRASVSQLRSMRFPAGLDGPEGGSSLPVRRGHRPTRRDRPTGRRSCAAR